MLARLEAYLRDLPGGLDAYPAVEQKAAVYHTFMDKHLRIADHADRLPPVVRALVERPAPLNTWIPEAHATAFYMALADVFFPEDTAFVAFAQRKNRELLESVVYRVLFKLLSPARVAVGGAARWHTFHRGGVDLAITIAPDRNEADVSMSFPPMLVNPLMARCYATAFTAAIEAAGAVGPGFEMTESTSTTARFHGRWR